MIVAAPRPYAVAVPDQEKAGVPWGTFALIVGAGVTVWLITRWLGRRRTE